jgi:hypothetical protein
MPRKPTVNYWESPKAYGCQISMVQHILAGGPDTRASE